MISVLMAAGLIGAAADGFYGVVEARFAAWDIDHDGKLSAAEVDRLAADPALKGESAAAVAVLKNVMANKKAPFGDVTIARLTEMSKHSVRELKARSLPDLALRHKQTLAKLGSTDRSLFGGDPAPTLESCKQGRLGDCFLVAPLGAAVFHQPDRVKSMFQLDNVGVCKVNFASGASVTVPPLSDVALALTGTTKGHGVWLNVIETAYAEHQNAKRATADRKTAATDAIRYGGSARPVIELLTGHVAKRVFWRKDAPGSAAPDPKMLIEKLAEVKRVVPPAVAAKRLVVAGTPDTGTVPGLTKNHAYAVLGYDAKNDTLSLWNPHANNFTPKGPAGLQFGYPTKMGRFSIPLAEFGQCFRGLSYETETPLNPKAAPGIGR